MEDHNEYFMFLKWLNSSITFKDLFYKILCKKIFDNDTLVKFTKLKDPHVSVFAKTISSYKSLRYVFDLKPRSADSTKIINMVKSIDSLKCYDNKDEVFILILTKEYCMKITFDPEILRPLYENKTFNFNKVLKLDTDLLRSIDIYPLFYNKANLEVKPLLSWNYNDHIRPYDNKKEQFKFKSKIQSIHEFDIILDRLFENNEANITKDQNSIYNNIDTPFEKDDKKKVDYCFKSANNKPNVSKELESFTNILDESIDVLITNSNIINILDELM